VTVDHELVADDAGLAALVDQLSAAPRYALDTEFHRERTYYPRLALLQIAWGDDQLALVDPLAVDLHPLAAVFDGPGLAVLHAADQDLEVLDHACGTSPGVIFDTQVAACFLGMTSPSLALLHERFLGVKLPKGDRLTDWLARPLSRSQLSYAASDVEHLLVLHDRLRADLEAAGRVPWAESECAELRARARGPREPRLAWTRIKEARQLRGRKLAVAQELAAWREETARQRDLPPRFVLPDLAVVAVAQRLPTTVRDLKGLRGLEERYLRNGAGQEVIDTVQRGIDRDAPWPAPFTDAELDRKLRPAAALSAAWLAQLARNLDLDAAVLATRSDIESFLRGDTESRLFHGWRHDVAGEGIRRLVAGEAALAFDGDGGLLLEPRPAP
jgi:ribonuclease D